MAEQHERPRNGGNKISYNQVTTSTTAAVAVPALTDNSRADVTVLNLDSSATIYLGDLNVTTDNGFPLAPGASITLKFWGAIWAVASTGTPSLAYIAAEDN